MQHSAHRVAIATMTLGAASALLAACVPPGGGDTRCPTWGCGSNTPVLNDHPLEALHIGGEPNAQGFSVVPVLQPHGIPLDVVGGEIVGRDPTSGDVMLSGMAVRDSFFVLQQPLADGTMGEWQVRINRVAKVPLWPVRAGEPTDYEYVTAYSLAVTGTGAALNEICPEARAWGTERYDGPEVIQQSDGSYDVIPWDEAGWFAVILKGETYHGADATVEKSGAEGAPWFHIACPGTAIAKMKLMGYDPEEQRFPTSPLQRQAALKMITARYCGAKSFTHEGQPLIWQNAEQWFRPDLRFGAARIGDVEALWDADGATCLNQPRDTAAWARDGVIAECGSALPECPPVGLDSIPAGNEWISLHHR